jgi:Family of unknown function (DUF6295)
MCTYVTYREPIEGSAKGPQAGWLRVTDAVVYFDHPVHAMAEHSLNVDLVDPSAGPGARVAVELTADSARRLVDAIEAALRSAEQQTACQPTTNPSAELTIGR